MLLLLFLSLITPSSSQLLYYYLYPSYYPTTPVQQLQPQLQSPALTQQQYICGSAPNFQYQSTPCSSAYYNPNCETECQSTQYCQRFDSSAVCQNGCCNSTLPNPNPSTSYFDPNQNINGFARDNSVTDLSDLSCPFDDPSAGACLDGNCPSGFTCNLDNVCCPCAAGAAQGACSAGSCGSSALQCEPASGMCCPRPLNGTVQQPQLQPQLQYAQPAQQQPIGGSNYQQQQQPQQYNQGGNYQQQLQYTQPAQQVPIGGNYQQQPQQQQQLQYTQPAQQIPMGYNQQENYQPQQYQPQQQAQNFQTQQYQYQQPQQQQQNYQNQPFLNRASQNPASDFVYNTQHPNPSTTPVPTIYPSSG